MKFHSICFLILSFVVLSCMGQTSKNIKTIEANAFSEKIKETPAAQILDVRTPEEFASGHIDNAKNVNWLSADFVVNTEKLDKSKPVFVYCKSGGRSQKAAEKLNELGFTTVYQLDGGILKWDAAGLSQPSKKTIGLSTEQYDELLHSDKKVLIDFYAEWCAPCKKMKPYLLQMEKELADKVVIIRLDADKNKTLMTAMKISELPTLLLYEKKEVKWKHSGFISEDDLRKQLQ
ncbi:thioredoxin domain-containing protein [Flavobacterium sp. XS2P39]|uniref:thioredoxin domain-containing protein n=1 Tax=Flavobacterium sp. XS2P39 TaxID=3401725 RepID=UPI003AAFDFE6